MEEKRDEAARVIHSAAAAAAAVGFFSPLPGADAVLIGPIQAALVLKLTSVYEQRPRSAALKAAGYAALGSVVGGGVAAGVTEAIGWAVVENLEEEGAP